MFWKYGITEAEFERIMLMQGGKCHICGVDHTAVKRPGSTKEGTKRCGLVVDHDHETGVIRGLLCDRCNRAIGLFGDDANILQAAASYLATGGVAFTPSKKQMPGKTEQRNVRILLERKNHPNACATQIWRQLHQAGVKVSKRTILTVLRD